MSQITVDGALASQLGNLEHHMEIVDPTGRVLGRFFPIATFDHDTEIVDSTGRVLGRFFPKFDLTQWEPTEPFLSEEELERRLNSPGKRHTTAEVLARLEKL